jgi:hypothetical protein
MSIDISYSAELGSIAACVVHLKDGEARLIHQVRQAFAIPDCT